MPLSFAVTFSRQRGDSIVRTIDRPGPVVRLSSVAVAWSQARSGPPPAEADIEAEIVLVTDQPPGGLARQVADRRYGLLRQYFPKGTDLSVQNADALAAVALALNTRPRKTLGWRTPAEALDDVLRLAHTGSCDDQELEQYASGDYQRVLAEHWIGGSMSRDGDCWDNAAVESFFATLKIELVRDAAWATRAAARTDLFDYLEIFYNGRRRHSALGYLSPRVFEQRREQVELAT